MRKTEPAYGSWGFYIWKLAQLLGLIILAILFFQVPICLILLTILALASIGPLAWQLVRKVRPTRAPLHEMLDDPDDENFQILKRQGHIDAIRDAVERDARVHSQSLWGLRRQLVSTNEDGEELLDPWHRELDQFLGRSAEKDLSGVLRQLGVDVRQPDRCWFRVQREIDHRWLIEAVMTEAGE